MRIALHYPSRCTSRPIDPVNLWTSERGLTGSEVACVRYALELGKLGHDVELFGAFTSVHDIGMTVTAYPDTPDRLNNLMELIHDSAEPLYDSTISWMVPDACRIATSCSFSIYNQQCSDFAMCEPGWEQHPDLFCSLSHSHARYMAGQTTYDRNRFRVMPNGVDTDEYRPGAKQSGKCIWASSHDRGLHHLLEVWPEVKRAVPHAELHVFYDTSGMQRFSENHPTGIGWVDELTRRSCYSLEALERLGGKGVKVHGSVSRERLRAEMASAEVLAYPCDPVRYTETFGSTVLESMASGCVPVLCLSDAFQELWGEACPAVLPPFKNAEYARLLAGVLTRHDLRAEQAMKCRERAKGFEWSTLGQILERTIESEGRGGFVQANFG